MEVQIKKITLADGLQIGIKNLSNILREVAHLKLSDVKTIKQELLKRVEKSKNHVPHAARREYAEALMREYRNKYEETGKAIAKPPKGAGG